MCLQVGWPCNEEGWVTCSHVDERETNWKMSLERGERVVDEGSRGMTLRSWERWERVTALDCVGSKH